MASKLLLTTEWQMLCASSLDRQIMRVQNS